MVLLLPPLLLPPLLQIHSRVRRVHLTLGICSSGPTPAIACTTIQAAMVAVQIKAAQRLFKQQELTIGKIEIFKSELGRARPILPLNEALWATLSVRAVPHPHRSRVHLEHLARRTSHVDKTGDAAHQNLYPWFGRATSDAHAEWVPVAIYSVYS